ncbi:MAG TPA: TIGR03435 family protein [Bryobacteraceae bacterium]|nr:TIGR03435 family protein [Bryobacteraceae bacterium]
MTRITVGVCLALLSAVGLCGQSSTPPLTFEVASIKPSATDDRRVMIQIQPGGGLRTSGSTLKMLLTMAYDVREFQISGGPGWINTDRYDILAKAERSAGTENLPGDPRTMTDEQRKTVGDQMRERLRALLADRFQLTLHRETKEESVYALVVAKNGPKLQESQTKEGTGPHGMLRMGRGEVAGQGVQLQGLTMVLSDQLGRTVIDRTGLKGNFDFKLTWTPDPGQSAGPPGGGPPPGADAPPPPDPNGPSIFTALQEQLGLRLESQKGPVEMLVIDRVEKPSEN